MKEKPLCTKMKDWKSLKEAFLFKYFKVVLRSYVSRKPIIVRTFRPIQIVLFCPLICDVQVKNMKTKVNVR